MIFLITLFLFLSSCTSNPKHAQEAINCRSMIEKEICKEYGFQVCGNGGELMYGIESFYIDFANYRKVTLAEARMLYIEILEKGLILVNSNFKVRPFLQKYPFTGDELEIILSFYTKDGKNVLPPYIALVFMKNGNIIYAIWDNETNFFKTLHKETYEQALQIVNEQK